MHSCKIGRAHQRRRSTIDDLHFTKMLPKRHSVSTECLECLPSLFPNYPTPTISAHNVQVIEEVGRGFSGIVFKAWYRPTRTLVAVKMLHGLGAPQHLLGELDLVLRCKGPQLVPTIGIMANDYQVSIVMEWMDGGSFEGLCFLPEPLLASISKNVLLGLKTLHDEYEIFHCDLKPSNILFNSQGHIRICDFGESRPRPVSASRQKRAASAVTITNDNGSESYMAPERITRTNPLCPKADIWSLGVTIYELNTSRHPYGREISLVELVESLTIDPEPRLSQAINSTTAGNIGVSAEFYDFCARCLTRDVRQRGEVKQLLRHAFLERAWDERAVAKWARCVIEERNKLAQRS